MGMDEPEDRRTYVRINRPRGWQYGWNPNRKCSRQVTSSTPPSRVFASIASTSSPVDLRAAPSIHLQPIPSQPFHSIAYTPAVVQLKAATGLHGALIFEFRFPDHPPTLERLVAGNWGRKVCFSPGILISGVVGGVCWCLGVSFREIAHVCEDEFETLMQRVGPCLGFESLVMWD